MPGVCPGGDVEASIWLIHYKVNITRINWIWWLTDALSINVFTLNQCHVWVQNCDLKPRPKRSRHFNATYRNIVGCNMLRAIGHPVTTCWDMLGVVGSNLKMVKFVDVAWCCSLGMRISSIFNSHTCCNTLGQQCWDVALQDVAIVWLGIYRC